MENQNQEQPQKKSINDVVNEYKEKHSEDKKADVNEVKEVKTASIPHANEQFKEIMQKETDPDLTTTYEIVKFPSEGLFYSNKISEVEVEYMTSKDEDLITTPSLIEKGKVLDVLLKRKIKTQGINIDELLPGDRNAILLFLRTSSYGFEYAVEVSDPRTGIPFQETVDLGKLKYKELEEKPDINGHFEVYIPMRKKNVKFKLLSVGEDNHLFNQAEAIKEAYNLEFSEYNTMKLIAQIVSIEENTDKNYIKKFVEAMPALDALTIKRKVLDVSPDVDMQYEFTAKDGFKFPAKLTIGVDFFFPAI